MNNQESNIMYVGVSVIEPPVETITILPEKDACVSSKECIFNYGTSAEMLVNYNSSNEWQSFITFSVPALDDITIKNLKQARLEFTLSTPAKRDIVLTLSFHNNTRWSETGITWVNMPAIYKSYKTLKVCKGDSKVIFDILDLIAENDEYTQYGFTLHEINNEDQDINLYIRTKESVHPPKLIYEYKVFPDNMDTFSLDSSVNVHLLGNQYLPSVLNVKNGITYKHLDTNLNVIGYEDNIVLDSSVSICNKNVHEITANLKINEYFSENDLTSLAIIYHNSATELPSAFQINEYISNHDIDTSAVINLSTLAEFPSSVNINTYEESFCLNSTASICITVSGDKDGNLDPPDLIRDNEMSTIVNINEYNDTYFLDSAVNIHEIITLGLDSSVNIAIKEESADMNTSVLIRGGSYLDASATINQLDSVGLESRVVVYPTYYKDLDSKVFIDLNQKKPYAFIM